MKRKYTATSLITLAFLVGGAQAGTYTVVGGQVKNDSIAIGKSSEASSPKDANVSSVAVGKSANATGEGSIAIGDSAAVKLDTTKPKENLDGSIAIGRLAIVKTTRGTAIGSSALVEGHESSAFGSSAQATEQLSLAIGSYAKSFVDHGVALGASSEVKRSGGVAGYDFSTGTSTSNTSPVWKSTYGAVSVGKGTGKDEKTRQIIHVAAGSEDTDAVNVAQLKASQASLTLASGEKKLKLTENKTANGTSYALSLDTSALQSTEVKAGTGVSVSKTGSAYTVTLKNDQTFGTVTADTLQVSSAGPSLKSTGISAANKTITAVAAGVDDADAVNVAQLKASQTKLELESNLLTKTESKTADGITYTLGIDASKLPKTDIVAGKGVSVSKTDPMKPIVLLNDDQDFSGTVTASEFKVGSSASLDTTGLNLIGTSTVTLKDSNPSPEKKTVLSTEGISVSSTTSHLGTHLTADGLYILTNVSLTKTGLVLGTGNPSVTTSGIKAGNKKITDLADGSDESDAVNVKQLKNARTTLQSSDENLVIASPSETNKGLNYSLSLKQDVNFNQVTTGNLVIGETGSLVFGTAGARLTNTGLELGGLNGPKFTTNGISAGGQQIKNVRAGTEGTDAVNVQQMEAHVKANKSAVVSDDVRIKVTPEEDSVNGGKKYKLSLNSDISLDSVKTGNATLSSDGLQITGGPSVTTTGIDAGSKEITNVARATTGTSAVNLNQMNDEIKKNKSSVAAGRGISVATSDDVEHGGKKYTVSLNENIEFTEVKTGDTTISSNGVSIAGGPSMTKENGINAGGKVITNVAAGVNDTDAVNVSQLNSRLNQSKVTVKAKENGNITVEQSAQTDNGTEYTVSLNDSVSVNEVHVAQNVHLSSEGVRVGNSGPIIAESGIDAANRTISNVAPGVRATDAVNVAQLNTAVNNVFRQVHSVEKDAQAGIAMAIATAGLPQAYLPGKSMMAISGGTYRGQSGYAFGFSHVTDNGRYVIKASGSGNSQGHYGASVGMGWQW